jgi:hypothetical protein
MSIPRDWDRSGLRVAPLLRLLQAPPLRDGAPCRVHRSDRPPRIRS